MNTLFVIQKDSLYAPYYIQRILEHMKNGKMELPAAICCFNPAEHNFLIKQASKRFKLYGAKQFIFFCALELITKAFSYLENVVSFKRYYSIPKICSNFDIPYVETASINSNYFHDIIRQKNIEILISIAINEKFSQETINSVSYALNVHSSLIPRYRGLMGLFWAHYDGNTETGVTIHRMVAKYDAGAILGQCKFSISDSDSLHLLYLKAIEHGSRMISDTIEQINNNIANEYIPNLSDSGYYGFPGNLDGKKYRALGKNFYTLKDLWKHYL
ncbi:bifunctional polymyxin resistance protein ArnA [bacterium BMS3Abin15]|nr:bifunctional polymyxin resistance protein ArnA [bacterium BMS3Abin15]